jgi:hypothetical protein
VFVGVAVIDLYNQPPSPIPHTDYPVYVPKVDADGNDFAGIRSTALGAALGTYTGWNLRKAGFMEDQYCFLNGSSVPFTTTQANRLAHGDPRLSLEERYHTHDGYVQAVMGAAHKLVEQRLLLSEDGDRLAVQAQSSTVLR